MKIVAVHQSAELYGSDRSFYSAIEALSAHGSAKVNVILPCKGPLSERISANGIEVSFEPRGYLRRAELKNPFSFLWKSALAFFSLRKKMANADILYVNTVVCFSAILCLATIRARKYIHVREIPTGAESYFFRILLLASGANVIFNSGATMHAFGMAGSVIYNGVDAPPRLDDELERGKLNRILVLGRLSDWKGQEFFLRSLRLVLEPLDIRIVGSTADPHSDLPSRLEGIRASLGDLHSISFFEFCEDPSPHFAWSDFVAVPSVKPEPFGRVAVEAFSFGKPVIAAKHGGLTEIVTHGADGFVFPPGSELGLARAIQQACTLSKLEYERLSKSAESTYSSYFSLSAYQHSISNHIIPHDMAESKKKLSILGTRGIPANHGGFETFAERLALHLVANGWEVSVYCQEDGVSAISHERWQGVNLVKIPSRSNGSLGTMIFDWKATLHASRAGSPCLTLGYNTAIFTAVLKLRGVPNLINMDGIEWSRAKWSIFAKAWLWINERAGCWLADRLIADHPEINSHLSRVVRKSKISTIPYGADPVTDAPTDFLENHGLKPNGYLTLIARPEPENSILEIVRGFSKEQRGVKLVVLGNYSASHAFQKTVLDSASNEVVFLGAIYDKGVLRSLRFHCLAYIHGHQVGGTNPSLVEALGARNAVIAHDNRFNRWVAGDAALYFDGEHSFSDALERLLESPETVELLRGNGHVRFTNSLTWPLILSDYESLLISSTNQDYNSSKGKP